MSAQFGDEEQARRLKEWWKQNGMAVVGGVGIGVAVVVGVNLWRDYRDSRAEEASLLFRQLATGVEQGAAEQARTAGDTLVTEFDDTPYATQAALMLARAAFEAGDSEAARERLEWVIANGEDPGAVHVARLRLSSLELAAGRLERALDLATPAQESGFSSQYAELRGDVHAAAGRNAEARQAYRQALDALEAGSPYRRILDMKLDDVPEDGRS